MNSKPSTSFYQSASDTVVNPMKLPNFRICYGLANITEKINSGCSSENDKNNDERPKTPQKIQNYVKFKKKIQTFNKFSHYYYQISCTSFSKVLFYTCRLCSFSLNQKKSLYKHFRANHPDIFPFPCRYCTSGFMFSGIRRNHELKYHNPSCSICKLNFCCQTSLTEHCKTCLISSLFNKNYSHNNEANIYRRCNTCISKSTDELYQMRHVPKHIVNRRLNQEFKEIEDVSSRTNFNRTVTEEKNEQACNKGITSSMPLINSFEDMNVSLERNNSFTCSSVNKSKCKVRDNNFNNCSVTLQDLFGPISDSESEVSIKEEIIDSKLENGWFTHNSLKFLSSYRNTNDQATQTISSFFTSISDNHQSTSNFNINLSSSNLYEESLGYNNNIDQFMKCYVCSFNTFKINLMVDHWSENHSKIHIKTLSFNLNELKSQKQTDKEQRAHNKKEELAHNQLVPHNIKEVNAPSKNKYIDVYENKLTAQSEILLNDEELASHNGKEVKAQYEKKKKTTLNEKERAQNETKETTLLNDKKGTAQNETKVTLLNKKELTAQNKKTVLNKKKDRAKSRALTPIRERLGSALQSSRKTYYFRSLKKVDYSK